MHDDPCILSGHKVFNQSLAHHPVVMISLAGVDVDVLFGLQEVDVHIYSFAYIDSLYFGLE